MPGRRIGGMGSVELETGKSVELTPASGGVVRSERKWHGADQSETSPEAVLERAFQVYAAPSWKSVRGSVSTALYPPAVEVV